MHSRNGYVVKERFIIANKARIFQFSERL